MSLTETFCYSIAFTVINRYRKAAAMQISTMFGHIYHVAFRRIPWNWTFWALISEGFSGSVISEIHQQWGSSLLKKCSKLKLDFKNAAKKSEKVFCFRDNCIWIGCVKLSLLKRKYLLSGLDVLGNRLEILHITNRDFLQVNCLHNDQSIW